MDEKPNVDITSKEAREELKSHAQTTRESGKLEEAIHMFERIVEWDKANSNPKGHIDALGHIAITYRLMADKIYSENKETAKELRYKSLSISKEALILSSALGNNSIQKVHFASASFAVSEYLDTDKEKAAVLTEAHQYITEAMEDFPGSRAHKAWPAHTKAKIEYALNKKEQALQTLLSAQIDLYEGYADEIKKPDGAMKLNVWASGIYILLADICHKENKPILAKLYAQTVIDISDPTNTLNVRKSEAQRILDKLS